MRLTLRQIEPEYIQDEADGDSQGDESNCSLDAGMLLHRNAGGCVDLLGHLQLDGRAGEREQSLLVDGQVLVRDISEKQMAGPMLPAQLGVERPEGVPQGEPDTSD